VEGGRTARLSLPLPSARTSYFGEYAFANVSAVQEQWESFYRDVAVLAFPVRKTPYMIADIDEKALYYREPYTSVPGVRSWFPAPANFEQLSQDAIVRKDNIIDLTELMDTDGILEWDVPPGQWTVMRFVSRNNGAVTRPAPLPGLGLEADKLDTTAINSHLEQFVGLLVERTGLPDKNIFGGLKMLHQDSWEMGAQNWTPRFREEFTRRRGYDPLPFYPVYSGAVVESLEKSERFLWDLRQTGQELVLENHALHVRKYAHRHNMGLSMQHYDMNPTSDMELGGVADVPSCEFWSRGFGHNSSWSCIQAASVVHTGGHQLLAAEAFTARLDAWKQYPGSMKNQGDWAFATGINRFFYHTYQHQPLPDHLRPGMAMAIWGVHHNRNQTWWAMSGAYHRYIARCQYLLQRGRPVADILYLAAEGAPHVFRAPSSAFTSEEKPGENKQLLEKDLALTGLQSFNTHGDDPFMPDRRGYNFSGCSPSQIMSARVEEGQIVFPCGSTFRLLVLPARETMTPGMLEKVASLIRDGAVVVGTPPQKSPSLQGYPSCDKEVSTLAMDIWNGFEVPPVVSERSYGKGRVIWGGQASRIAEGELYPHYDATAQILEQMGVLRDFESTTSLRYTHRSSQSWDIYFVANRTGEDVSGICTFRSGLNAPELWDPNTGETRPLPEFTVESGRTHIPMTFAPYQSFFVVFPRENRRGSAWSEKNFPGRKVLDTLQGSWDVYFDPVWGGPGDVHFEGLTDWTLHADEGIRYYSGTAVYRKAFDADVVSSGTR
ncbi:MAG: glycosyl hydrolase, partial [Bacteroidales bacterium]|nr:glycosyl hydrolase [Bacteroidales bacterium]